MQKPWFLDGWWWVSAAQLISDDLESQCHSFAEASFMRPWWSNATCRAPALKTWQQCARQGKAVTLFLDRHFKDLGYSWINIGIWPRSAFFIHSWSILDPWMSFRHFLALRLRFGAVSPGKRVPQTLELLNTTPVRAFVVCFWGISRRDLGKK